MDLGRLDQAFEFEKETSQHGGWVVVRHGYLVLRKYFGKAIAKRIPTWRRSGKRFTSIVLRDHDAGEARPDPSP